MLSGNEEAELSEAELIRLIRIQRWNPGSRSIDPKVHELDGSSHGGLLLLIQEWTEIRPSCLKDMRKR